MLGGLGHSHPAEPLCPCSLPSLNLLLPHLSIATCNVGNAYARGECGLPHLLLVPVSSVAVAKSSLCLPRWKEASHRNQLRYSESMKILREMYDRQ
jgi:hypothetical protein